MNLFFITRAMLVFIGLLSVNLSIQGQVLDDFSDGNFTENPVWIGDIDRFKVNASNQLQSNGTGSDTLLLATRNPILFETTEWQFWIKLSFNTSANNYSRFYLMTDTLAIGVPLQGYYLQIGGGSDSITLIRQNASTLQTVLSFSGYLTNQSVNNLRIRLVRTFEGRWDGWLDDSGGTQWIHQGTAVDPSVPVPGWAGFYCRFTASNATKCYLDDVYIGPEIHDTVSPRIVSLAIADSVRLALLFSEAPDPATAADPANYRRTGNNAHPIVVSVKPDEPERVFLTFSDPFPMQLTDSLAIHGITDPSGNRMNDTTLVVIRYLAVPYDLLIHEIMADPEPTVGLPPVEYLELYNRSAFPISLDGWSLSLGSSQKSFPPVTIPSKGFITVSSDTTLEPFGPTLQLFSSGSSLSNAGSTIALYDASHRVIHSVSYNPSWGLASWKQEGGWSLEMKDPENPCGCSDNWGFSEDPSGGTPGRQNTIHQGNPDTIPPGIMHGFLLDATTWVLVFSEQMDTLSFSSWNQWEISPGAFTLLVADPVEPVYNILKLEVNQPFQSGVFYTLHWKPGPTDCAGNPLATGSVARAAFPVPAERREILFNEILFDPTPATGRFIELVNHSENVLDLSSFGFLATGEGEGFTLSDAIPLGTSPFLVYPGEYIALCEDPHTLMKSYACLCPGCLITLDPFPRLNNTGGSLALIRLNDEEIIDRMDYHEQMHYPLLSSTEGVSLERISLDGESREPGNWHSASSLIGYATPGYRNSQWKEIPDSSEEPSIDPSVFSPDNDGYQDVTAITGSFSGGGQMSVTIFSASGKRINVLASNALIGPNTRLIWDGTDDQGRKVPMGIYIVLIHYLNPDGIIRQWKKTVVVATRFS